MIGKEKKSWHRAQVDFTYLEYKIPHEVTEISATLYGSSVAECALALTKLKESHQLHMVRIFPLDKVMT